MKLVSCAITPLVWSHTHIHTHTHTHTEEERRREEEREEGEKVRVGYIKVLPFLIHCFQEDL